jgi:hypothetical protein
MLPRDDASKTGRRTVTQFVKVVSLEYRRAQAELAADTALLD